MKTRFRRYLSILLIALLAISCCGFTAAATTEKYVIADESTTRATINAYMESRKQFLTDSNLTSVDTCHPGITEDETAHRTLLKQSGITFLDSTFVIDQVWCAEKENMANVTETVTYKSANGTATEIIMHEMYLGLDENRSLRVISDRYAEKYSQFQSRSYVPPYVLPVLRPWEDGTVPKIASRANSEVYAGNMPGKYPTEGQWSVIFVTWCAEQAPVSNDVIPDSLSCTSLATFYANRSLYYPRSTDADFIPQAGDLFFLDATPAPGLEHMGIVIGYRDGYFSYVAGNDGPDTDSVCAATMSIDDERLDGFARPQYP